MSQPQNACSSPVTPADNDLLLRQVKIAAPCSVKWETMPGGERVRSCAQCSHKVYNLSAMSGDEAANLIREAEGRVCVRLYRRADGSVMTSDCPTGLRAVRQRMTRTVAVSFASVFSIMGLFSLAERLRARPVATMGAMVATPQPASAPIPLPMAVEMGEIEAAIPDPTTPPHSESGYELGIMQSSETPLPLPMVAPTPDAEKTFLPHETEPSEIRSDPFAPVMKETGAAKAETPARP
jgi:hypothetical protein